MAHICLSLQSLSQADQNTVVVSCDERSTSAAVLHQHVALLSRGLCMLLNVHPGDRIGLIGLNTDVFFCSLLAVLDAGGVACPLNWRWSSAELASAIGLLQPKVLLVDDHCMPLATQACTSSSVRIVQMVSPPPAEAAMMYQSQQQQQQQQATHHNTTCSHTTASTISTLDLLQGAQTALSRQQLAPSSSCNDTQHGRTPPPDPAACPLQLQLQLLQPGCQQPALIVFTSGTTGASKGVMLSHSSLVHQSLAKLAVVQYTSSDTYLHMAPLFHIGGLSSAFAVLMAGGRHVFMPRYSPATALQLVRRHSVTSLIAVPAMMQDLTQAAAADAAAAETAGGGGQQSTGRQQHAESSGLQQQLPSLQRVLVGAGGMPRHLQLAVAALFPNADLHTAYGMTEASSSITFISVSQQQQLMAAAAAAGATAAQESAGQLAGSPRPTPPGVCVGQPGPGIAVGINTAAVSNSSSSSSSSSIPQQPWSHQQQQQQHTLHATAWRVGEVCTRGPHVMLGYWRDAAATTAALSPSGWLHTGDLGYLDAEGHVWLVGRLKDMIKTGGENVHAAEVEAVLLSHPAVAATAVFGLDHARLGEQVAAAVVLQPQWAWDNGGGSGGGGAPSTQQLAAVLLAPPQGAAAAAAAGTSAAQSLDRSAVGGGHTGRSQQVGSVSAADLQQHCRAAPLSPYKLPRVVVCVSQLPLNTSGKVVKAVLKQQVQQQVQAAAAAAADKVHSDLQQQGKRAGVQPRRGRSKL